MKKKAPTFDFKFVPMGSIAPELIPAGEIWLDVGNRIGPRVLDHHGDICHYRSAAQIVMERIEELVVANLQEVDSILIVLHSQPDLDAIFSAWLVYRRVVENQSIHSEGLIDRIAELVSDNDQGLIKTRDAIHCWPIVMRAIIGNDSLHEIGREKILQWFDLIEKTRTLLEAGQSMDTIAETIATPEIRLQLTREQNDYLNDLHRGFTFQAMLPLAEHDRDMSLSRSSEKAQRRVLCDSVFFRNPSSLLFKELARGDELHSNMKKGFNLIVVCEDIQYLDQKHYFRFIISTDPMFGTTLKGRGQLLESKEKSKEDILRGEILPGRERVPMGQGRFGGDVISPWYDGRGHGYTIVDSPSMKDDSGFCLTQLNIQEVLETIWDYCDPAQFLEAGPSELDIFIPHTVTSYPKGENPGSSLMEILQAARYPDAPWSQEFLYMVSDAYVVCDQPLVIEDIRGVAVARKKTISYFPGISIDWLHFELNGGSKTFKELIEIQALIRMHPAILREIRSSSLELGFTPVYFIHARLFKSSSQWTGESRGQRLILMRMATGSGSEFPTEAEYENSNSLQIEKMTNNQIYLGLLPESIVCIEREKIISGTDRIITDSKSFFTKIREIVLANTAIKAYLAGLSRNYVQHLYCRRPLKLGHLLQEDRERFFWFEHRISFSRINENALLQQIHTNINTRMDIPAYLDQVSRQIKGLADSMKEARAQSLSRLSFFVTTAVSPLLITLSMFSGRFMDKEFAIRYQSIIPNKIVLFFVKITGVNPGWSSFILTLFVMYGVFILLWQLIGGRQSRKLKKVRNN